MTGRQKYLLYIGYTLCPQYEIKFDKDRDVMSLRVWITDYCYLSITDVPSLAGTDKYQVRYCEQTKSYHGPSPRCGELDKLFGKKARATGKKYAIVDANKIRDVLSSIKYVDKLKRTPLQEEALWFNQPRNCFF